MQRRTALDPRSTLRSERAQSTQGDRLPRHLAAGGGRSRPVRARAGATSPHPRPTTAEDDGLVTVIQVSGYLDPIEVTSSSVPSTRPKRTRSMPSSSSSTALAPWSTTPRSTALVARVRDASVTVGVWVGPSGAEASGGAARVVEAAKYRGLAPGSRLEVDGQHSAPTRRSVRARPTSRPAATASRARPRAARRPSATSWSAFPAFRWKRSPSATRHGRCLPGRPGSRQLSLLDRLMHSVASPPVAYLLFVIGMALLLFELFTAGVGVAGVVGAGAFLLGCYGLAVLPTRAVGRCPARVRHVRLRGRHPDRRAAGVDRHRHRLVRDRVADPLRRHLAVVDHAAGGDRRHDDRHARGHAGDGAGPVLHARRSGASG